MTKRLSKLFIAVLISLCLLATAAVLFVFGAPATASADGETTVVQTSIHDTCDSEETNEAAVYVGDTLKKSYASFADAIGDALDGETVKVLKCFSRATFNVSYPTSGPRDITIDFNYHTLTTSGNGIYLHTVNDRNLTQCTYRFVNGKILGGSYGVTARASSVAYFTNMDISGSTSAISKSGTNNMVYVVSGHYANSQSGNAPITSSCLTGDTFRYIDTTNPPVFRSTATLNGSNAYKGTSFNNLTNVPAGLDPIPDEDGNGFTFVKRLPRYFIGVDGVTTYLTIAEAIQDTDNADDDGNIIVKLNRHVPEIGVDEEFNPIPLVFEIPEGKSVTLDLNKCTFSAKLVNSGNVILTGPNTTSGNEKSVFDGTVENKGNGKITAVKRFTISGAAKEYVLNNTITLNDDSYILLSGDNYEIQESKLELNGRKWSSYTAAIKGGVRDIIISKTDAWLQKVWDYDWDTDTDYVKSGYWYENINVDIGNSELTITLNEVQLRGLGSADGRSMTLNIISGKVTIKDGGGEVRSSLRAPADNSSYNPENIARAYTIQNAGELTIEGVNIGGGVYTNNNGSVVQGALIHNTGKLIIKNSTIENTLVDNREGVERGSGIDTAGGSVELDNVHLIISGGYGVCATGDAAVKMYNGTRNISPANGTDVKLGALYLEDDATAELGKCDIYVDSKFDLTPYVEDGLCVKRIAGTTPSDGNIVIDRYQIAEHKWAEPEWKWNENTNLLCDAEFTCENGGEKVTVPATVTYQSNSENPCAAGAVITYTATVEYSGATYTKDNTVTNQGGEHNYILRMSQAALKMTYMATETFDTTGMFVQLYCSMCGTFNYIQPSDIDIIYEDGNCFHYGDSKITLSYATADNKTYTCDVLVTVNPFESEVTWQYKHNDGDWTDITENTVFAYDGAEWYIRAKYSKANGEYGYAEMDSVLNAGAAVRSIDASALNDYLFDAADLRITLTVAPQMVDISDEDTFLLGLSIGTETPVGLLNGPVYIYKTPTVNRYPSYVLLDTVNDKAYQGWTFVETVSATGSVVRHRGTETQLQIGVRTYNSTKFTYEIDTTSQYRANAVGIYTVIITLTATDNYGFESKFTSALYNRGLAFEISADNKTAIVSKIWYVVQIDNYFVVSAGSTVEYGISDWTYGDDVTLTAPALAKGTDMSRVTYTLYSGDTRIGEEEFGQDDFTYYINSSMFVGMYRLEATIPAMLVDDIMCRGATYVYNFEVSAATIEFNMTATAGKGYADYTWEYNAGNRTAFFEQFGNAIKDKYTLNTVTPAGYWATVSTNSTATVTYNFARMNSGRYYGITDDELLREIAGGTNGTYTVYFEVSADNHNSLTTTGESRYQFYFTVTVYQYVDVPTVSSAGLVYTGSKVLPTIEDSDLYETVWSESDAYIAGGAHSVSFTLYDNVHYRWSGESGDTVTVSFTIAQADNAWVRVPNIVDWSYETFDTQINRIYAVTKFLDAGQHIMFSVTKADGTVIDGLTSFTVNADGTVDDKALISALNSLAFGSYKLNVTVAATDNYNVLNQSVDFTISKAMNTWADGDDDLALPSWIVGKYSETDNPIVVNAAHGIVNIIVTDIDGNEYYNSITGVNKLNDCEVGKYLLKAWVDETEDYAALAERTFTIEVLKKVGLPWWATLLITVGALLLAALIIFILWKKGVFQILTEKIVVAIRTKASVDATIASVRAAKMMEEGRQSVAEAKRRERIEALQKRAKELREMPPEERAALLDAKAQAEAEKAEKSRQRSEQIQARANKLRGNGGEQPPEQPDEPDIDEIEDVEDVETPTEE